MSPGDERPPEGDGGEGVPRLSEGGEEKAAPPAAGLGASAARRPSPPAPVPQQSSARSRIMRFRTSGSRAMGVQMSVPTPASR